MEQVKLVQGTLYKTYSLVGPSHDPYGREEFEMVAPTGKTLWKLTICGLAGCTFEKGAVTVSEFDGGPLFEAAVEAATGQPLHFWDSQVWEYKERSLMARMSWEEYVQYCEMRDADHRLMGYAM